MKQLKKACTWFYMLSKRLYMKPSFLLILLLIVSVVFTYGKMAEEDSGILTVVLAQEDPTNPMSTKIVKDLVDSSPLIRYKVADTVEDAEEQVRMQRADAAWIFPGEMENKVWEFVSAQTTPKPIVRVVTRENSVSVLLSSEILSGILFKECARVYYVYYLRDDAHELESFTDEELLRFYDEALIGDQLFSFSNTSAGGDSSTDNYLLTPLRGLLAVLVVLCGIATAMYYIHDNEMGLFCFMPATKRPLAEFGYQLVSVLNIAMVALVSMLFLGLVSNFGRELLIYALYVFCVASFSMLVRVLCGSIRTLGTAMVLLVVLMIAICPVFYDLSALWKLQYLLPPTYFVNAAYNTKYLLCMPVYAIICLALATGIRVITRRY